MAVIYFLILVGVLIFVHEFGHYLFARLFGVRVLSFSIGFGPRAFGFKRGEEDWVVRWLPLGGYVHMLGSDPTEETPEAYRSESFQFKPLWQRALIILAGPLFNLILPIPIFFFVMFATHDKDLPPVVGQVVSDAPADGKLLRGDEIVEINGDSIDYWYQLVDRISDAAGESLTLKVKRGSKVVEIEIEPRGQSLSDELGLMTREVGRIGIMPSQYRSIVGLTRPDGPAANAGLETFDEVIAINGARVSTYIEVENALALAERQQKPVTLLILRDDEVGVKFGRLGIQRLVDPVILDPVARGPCPDDKQAIGACWGIDSADLFVSQVDEGSRAAEVLQRGDQILALNGKFYNNFHSISEKMRKKWEDEHTLLIQRGDERLEVKLRLEKLTVIGEFKEERPVITAGFYHHGRRVPPQLREMGWGDRFSYASKKSIETTVEASGLLVVALYRMAEGKLSRKSLGGPIMIGQMAGKAGEAGIEFFLQMMAYISINLGIINLLPIPVLDGGHLLLFAIEGIKRGPLSARTRQIASFIGLAIVIFLMIFALKNDLERYWSDWFA